ncbi:hypothetical protein B4U80_00096 [Leptotrombidium deliense]|uniref:Uncharacterized protein n=1 Tax=Leptotrombidium deliense TaxID=299467 RepID=A0A443S886_9ACAR|nr:hypothetical protein B4U80_00096 [Leptotrombidium deliense]
MNASRMLQHYATLKVTGELTGKLSKSMSVLERALNEFHFTSKNANTSLQMLEESHETVVKLGDELSALCNSTGIKGRKADKVAENYIWNLSVLKTEMDMLRSTKEDCDCALMQVERLGVALKRVFEHERESITISAKQENQKAVSPALLSGATLLPEPELKQPPLTPTSPGDARLRGILKKSTPAMSPCTDVPNEIASFNNDDKSSSDLGHNSDSSY